MRWKIAKLIDWMFPNWCWASIIGWVYGDTKFREIIRDANISCLQEDGECYCGKQKIPFKMKAKPELMVMLDEHLNQEHCTLCHGVWDDGRCAACDRELFGPSRIHESR